METHHEDDEEYSDEDSDAGTDDSEPRIISEIVAQNFTIDNIGQVSMQVKSQTKPLQVIAEMVPAFESKDGMFVFEELKQSLFIHVMSKDDTPGLKALLDMAQHYAGQKFEGEDDENDEPSSGSFTLSQHEFRWAVENGKTQQLALVIKRTGAGIPLDHLVKKSGVEMKRKPRFYQGLTVYGKKRNDWATAGRNMVVKTTGLKTPPLLHAALGGSIESVEFFLGDAPHKLYSEFGKSKAAREDSRLKHLKDSPGGFDRAISKWLGADNDLVIHCAVLAQPCDAANEVLEYVVEACPNSLEKKNSQGDSPLMVACRLGRVDFVKILVKANADQSTRNLKGENILHAAVSRNPKAHQLSRLLDVLDSGLRSHLFLQRKNLHENGNSPLHTWVSQASGVQPEDPNRYRYGSYYNNYNSYVSKPYSKEWDAVQVLKLLLEYSKGEELEMLNGAGETCLHTAIMHNMLSLAHVLVTFKHRLLYRENAVGRTPAEIAHDRLTGVRFAKPENLKLDKHNKALSMVSRKPEEFAHKTSLKAKTTEEVQTLLKSLSLSGSYSTDEVSDIVGSMGVDKDDHGDKLSDVATKQVMWDLCLTTMEEHPSKRRLVSLIEANDVAKRLGEKYSASRYFSVQAREEDEDDAENKDDKEDKATTDFATDQLNSRLNDAWKQKGEKKDEELDAESNGGSYCSDCGEYH